MAENTGRPDGEDDVSDQADDAPRRRLRDLTKEDVVKSLSERQTKRKNRRRMTGDDVEEMIKDRSAKRKAQRESLKADGKPDPRLSRLSVIAGAVLLLGAAGMVYGTTAIQGQTSAQVEAANEEIISLNSQIDQSQPQSEAEVEKRSQEVSDGLEAARGKAKEVVDLQNEFQSLLADGNDEKDPGNGKPKDSFIQSAEHRESLAPYFDAESFVIEDDTIAYNAGSDIPFTETEIDPRFQWYTQYTDLDHTAYTEVDKAGTWQLSSVVPSRTAEEGQVSVMWLNRAPDGALLAWAKATYTVEAGTFDNLTVGTTTLGDRYGLNEQGE